MKGFTMNRTATIATVAALGAGAAILLTVIVRRIMAPAIDDEVAAAEDIRNYYGPQSAPLPDGVAQLPDTDVAPEYYPEGWYERERPQRQKEEKDNG